MTRSDAGVGAGKGEETRAECHATPRNTRHIKIKIIPIDCDGGGCGSATQCTYSMANLRGFSDKTGNRKKQITKQARAPRLQAAKTRSRSHRLTVAQS